MRYLFMSGAGGSNNWVPLLIPLALFAALLYGIDRLSAYLKRRRLQRENELINHLSDASEPPAPPLE